MSGIAGRIGQTVVKSPILLREICLKRHSHGIRLYNGMFSKHVKRHIYIRFDPVAPITAQVRMLFTKQSGGDDRLFTYFGKGKITLEGVIIEVGPDGTKFEFLTDFNGTTRYMEVFKKYKNDEYEFLPKKGHNPEVQYNKEKNESVIKFCLSKKTKVNAVEQ